MDDRGLCLMMLDGQVGRLGSGSRGFSRVFIGQACHTDTRACHSYSHLQVEEEAVRGVLQVGRAGPGCMCVKSYATQHLSSPLPVFLSHAPPSHAAFTPPQGKPSPLLSSFKLTYYTMLNMLRRLEGSETVGDLNGLNMV
jgi:hypothetical protein